MENHSNIEATIEEYLETLTAAKMLSHAFKEILPNRNNKFGTVFCGAIALGVSIYIGSNESTISILDKISCVLFDAQLALFACIFAVYSIFLAFLNTRYIRNLANGKYDIGSQLFHSTSYFESTLSLYFIAIMLSVIVRIFANCAPLALRLTKCLQFDEFLAILLLLIYIFYSLRIIYELKSLIYNTVILFRFSIAYNLQDIIHEDDPNTTEQAGNNNGIK